MIDSTSGHLHDAATGPLRPTCPCHPRTVVRCPECFVCHVGACPKDIEAVEYDSPGTAHWIDPDHPPQRLPSRVRTVEDATSRLDAVRAVLGEPHVKHSRLETCVTCEKYAFMVHDPSWPCFHERVRRAVEGETE